MSPVARNRTNSLVDTTGDARVKERVIKNSRRRCNSNGKIDWTRQRKITAMLEQKAKDLEEERIKLVPKKLNMDDL